MPLIVFFPGGGDTDRAQVGGKGFSLIRMAGLSMPVPPGAVLTTSFFEPWFEEIKASETWRLLTQAGQDRWPALCAELKRLSGTIALTGGQRQALEQCRQALLKMTGEGLFAVRSSSPEEDLASASFAGGYETRLGVRLEHVEDAVRHCFASSLDERVLVYKAQHGFDVLAPRTAVVVQQQIASEVSGVAFSLNPLTNDYDEAVIDANWGLGESVVSGQASPDHFVVDRVSGKVVERQVGAKQVSIWLGPDGGTLTRSNHRSAELTLGEDQLAEVTATLGGIETVYGEPTDIEWAYAAGQLFVLQARPITTYVPLPPEMVTAPGQRRRLYMDGALSDGLTINAPISPMGMDWMEDLTSAILKRYAGRVEVDTTPDSGLFFAAGGRLYSNLSNSLWFSRPERLARRSEALSSLTSAIIANIDVDRYRSATRPPWARWWTLRLVPKVLWRMRTFFWNTSRRWRRHGLRAEGTSDGSTRTNERSRRISTTVCPSTNSACDTRRR